MNVSLTTRKWSLFSIEKEPICITKVNNLISNENVSFAGYSCCVCNSWGSVEILLKDKY